MRGVQRDGSAGCMHGLRVTAGSQHQRLPAVTALSQRRPHVPRCALDKTTPNAEGDTTRTVTELGAHAHQIRKETTAARTRLHNPSISGHWEANYSLPGSLVSERLNRVFMEITFCLNETNHIY